MITVFLNGTIYAPYETKVFSGGEIHVKFDMGKVVYHNTITWVRITTKLTSSEEVMRLMMVVDALRQEYGNIPLHLDMDYLPYARQDRVCAVGEAFSLKVFCKLINSMDFSSVRVVDCHSQVGLALLNNAHNYPQATVICHYLRRTLKNHGWDTIVAPDLGAHKKAEDVGKELGLDVVQATKKRDPNTGKLSCFQVLDVGALKGRKCLIVDDLCDGGGTFIGLVDALRLKGAERIGLYVTHGIFSKGLDCLYDAGINHIYTTNSFTNLTSTDKFTVVNLQ